MKSQPSHSVAQAICSPAVMALLLMANVAVGGQSLPNAPIVKDPKSESRQRQDREATLRSAEVGATMDKAKQRRAETDIEQIKQDYKRIQILRNEMAHIVLSNQAFDYKAISERAEAVGKSADRLKTHLLPKATEEKPAAQKRAVEFNQGEMKGALVRLCKLIDRFVENPMLKNPDVTDAQQALQAANDLLNIIELSGDVKRSAERLKPPR
jgi:cell fate (sporulation/competence/biofilm development) regulator YmcA (YheA/YmcA/DUF963 family)